MLKIIIGLLVVVCGFMMSLKSMWFLRQFGRIRWAEDKFPFEGGTRFFYKIFGIVIVFIGLFIISGIWTDILNGIFKLFDNK